MVEAALKIGLVGEHADARGAMRLVDLGNLDRIEVGPNQPAEGLAFLTSAISLIGPSAASAAKKSRTGGASFS